MRLNTDAGLLQISYSVRDVVTGPTARRQRISFTFDYPGTSISLKQLSPSAVLVESRGGGAKRYYLKQDSATTAHADFVQDGTDRPGWYDVTVELEGRIDGYANFYAYRVRALSFLTKRATTARAASSRSGSTVTVSGSLRRIAPIEGGMASAWRGYGGQAVSVWFDPAGTAGRVYKGTAKTTSTGAFTKKLAYPGKGTWSATFSGNWSHAPSGTAVTGAVESPPRPTVTVSSVQDGTKVSMKVSTSNVTVGTGSKDLKVRLTYALDGEGRVGVGSETSVCATPRLGHYQWHCSDAVVVSRTEQYAVLPISGGDPAGIYDIVVWGEVLVDRGDSTWTAYLPMEETASFMVRKDTSISARLSSSTVAKGASVRVSGTLTKVVAKPEYDSARVPLTGAAVRIYFDPAGTGPEVYKGSATTGSTGAYSRSFTATTSGTWRVAFPSTTYPHLGWSSARASMKVR